MHIEFDRRLAENIVLEMMAIPGPSGQEGAVAAFITRQLRRAGVPSSAIRRDNANHRSPLGGETGNLIVRIAGTVRAPRRLLMAHLDTVPICVGARPVRRGRRVVAASSRTGLGADNRAGAAAVLVALLEIYRRKLSHPPLTFLWTVQEEVGLIGVRHVALSYLGAPRLAFNFDGGSPAEVVHGATGASRMTIHVHGAAAHAGTHPERGVSAIAVAGLAIARLQTAGWHGLVRKGRRRGTSNIGALEAGGATNVVTESAKLRAEARSHDRRFRRRIVRAYRAAFTDAASAVTNQKGRRGRVEFETTEAYESFALRRSEPSVAAATEAIRTTGIEPVYRIVDGGLDANWMHAHGIPTVSLGVGQKNIHTVREALDLREFHTGCRIALTLAAAGGVS